MAKGQLEHELLGVIRLRQMSQRTEETYVQWYRRYVRFQKEVSGKMRHPKELGAAEVTMFLTHLAQNLGLGASSQNQALNAIVFDSNASSGVSRPSGFAALSLSRG